jgi:hypothetical protein
MRYRRAAAEHGVSCHRMSTEASKALVELAMFRKFIAAAVLPVAVGSEQKGAAALGEPDVICTLAGQLAGFELAEACAPEFAAAAAAALTAPSGVASAWGNDVSPVTLRKKLAKRYAVSYPVHLLLYRNGLTALPDAVIVARLQPELQGGLGQFRSIWFHGDNAHLLASDDS